MGSPYVPFKGPTIAGFGGALVAIDFNQKERVAVDFRRCSDAQLARRFVVALHVCRRVDAEARAHRLGLLETSVIPSTTTISATKRGRWCPNRFRLSASPFWSSA